MTKLIYSVFIIVGFSSCPMYAGISESNSQLSGKCDLDYTIKHEGATKPQTTIPDNGDISYNFGVSEVTISGFKIEGKWGDGIFGDREPEEVKKEEFTENRGYWISEDNKKLTIKNEYNISEPYDIIELTKSKLVLKTTF